MILVLLLLGLVYAVFLNDEISYDSKHIRKVQIPNAPPDVQRLLKTTSLKGELVFVFLLLTFNGEENLSQTDLVSRIKERYRITLTHQAIRMYIVKLEKHRLIHSPKPTREYEYALSDQGKWCLDAVRVCFPRTTFWYIIRHFLGFRRLPQYPVSEILGERSILPAASQLE
jgi:hypothetical protein